MLFCALWGLVASFKTHRARPAALKNRAPEERRLVDTFKQYSQMLWQEGLPFFALVWVAQLAEAVS